MSKKSSQGLVVILTGPPASGKSTLARALQGKLSALGSPWLYNGVDAFADSLRRDWSSFEGNGGQFAERGFTYERDAKGGLILSLGEDGRRVLSAFHRAMAAVASAGVDVVCEAVVYDQADWEDWTDALNATHSIWINLNAPLSVLEERESTRPEAVHGLARGTLTRKKVGVYDLEIDTATTTVNEAVNRIIVLIEATQRRQSG